MAWHGMAWHIMGWHGMAWHHPASGVGRVSADLGRGTPRAHLPHRRPDRGIWCPKLVPCLGHVATRSLWRSQRDGQCHQDHKSHNWILPTYDPEQREAGASILGPGAQELWGRRVPAGRSPLFSGNLALGTGQEHALINRGNKSSVKPSLLSRQFLTGLHSHGHHGGGSCQCPPSRVELP